SGVIDEITILNLATQTAGFDFEGGYPQLLYQPETAWLYSNGGVNWLAEVLTLAFGQDLKTLMFNRVFNLLGITGNDLTWRDNYYRSDRINGIKNRELGSGISANVDALARIGYLMLRNGQWEGQEIIQSSYLETATKPVAEFTDLSSLTVKFPNAPKHYGLLIWNNADSSLQNIPTDTYTSWGKDESFIIVIPSLEMVISRAGGAWHSDPVNEDFYGYLQEFLNFIVPGYVYLNVKVFLEGPFDQGTGEMRTDLNNNGVLPTVQPFSASPWNYGGRESVVSIPNADIVDWVLVELRKDTSLTIVRRAAFLKKDGNIVDLEGNNPLKLAVVSGDYYVVVYHRNHIAVMSSVPVFIDSLGGFYDFSVSANTTYGSNSQKFLGVGIYGMYAGDASGDGQVQNDDKNNFWSPEVGTGGYHPADFNLNSQVQNDDKNQYWKFNVGRGSQVP
ncbi:MAG: serine hydrolase, partial [Calditrichia bacterium]